jgi:hypothetical protein
VREPGPSALGQRVVLLAAEELTNLGASHSPADLSRGRVFGQVRQIQQRDPAGGEQDAADVGVCRISSVSEEATTVGEADPTSQRTNVWISRATRSGRSQFGEWPVSP